MKFIIDTDMGIDDAIASLMVLAYPGAEILAITTVMGNVPLPQVVHNTGVVLDVASAPAIPVFRGCARPMLQYQPDDATYVHGQDGLGGAGRAHTARTVENKHASLALIDLAHQYPGEITLLTLGPLTNVALALRLDTGFIEHLKALVIMGGAVDARGNTSAPAEFNVAVDPEAASMVFKACVQAQTLLTLISWETTLVHAIPFSTWGVLCKGSSAAAKFVQQMTGHIKRIYGGTDVLWPDPLAAAVALDPSIVQVQETRFVTVETGQNLARGQTIVDYRSRSIRPYNAQIVKRINLQRFHDLLEMGIRQ